jgi:hypothetical protein
MMTLCNCQARSLKTDKPKGKVHVHAEEDDLTLCGLAVEGPVWYLEELDSLKVTCPKCWKMLDVDLSHCRAKEIQWKKDWARVHGNYVDRFFVQLQDTNRDLIELSPRDVAAEFFEFLKAEGRLKK